MEFLYAVLVVFLVIIVVFYFIYTQFVKVESETEWIVDRLGKDRVLKEGINRFIPFLDEKIAEVDMREFRIDPPAQEIITKDNIKLKIDVISSVRIIDSLKAIKSIRNYEESVKSEVSASVFSILGNMKLEDIQQQVDSITKQIKEHVEKQTIRWGIKIEQIRIENMTPPKAVVDAMEKEIAAEREKKAAISKAEGEHKVAELHADSEKVLIEKRAAATHKVIKDLKELMPNISDEKIMEFLTKTSYIDSMSKLSSSANSKFVLYPSEVEKPMDKVMSAEYMSQAMSK